MIRAGCMLLMMALLLLSACTPREQAASGDAGWEDVRPLADDAAVATNSVTPATEPKAEDYTPWIRRLEELTGRERAEGETLITGEALVLDYERRYVRMDQHVRVTDARGVLETGMLLGRYSEDGGIEMIEAHKGVRIQSENRTAEAARAVYSLTDGAVKLEGGATVTGEGIRLAGGTLQLQLAGSRRVTCHPDAVLEIDSVWALQDDEPASNGAISVIRCAQIIYDEEESVVRMEGGVRLRDPRVDMNCGSARIHLKENNEIDWIEALSEVIIESVEGKALAERAFYFAEDGRFVLEGKPKIMVDRNIMTGDRITYWHGSGRVVCEPADFVLYPDEEMKAKFLTELKD